MIYVVLFVIPIPEEGLWFIVTESSKEQALDC